MKLTLSALTIGLVGMAFGQLANTDHGTLKSGNTRTGVNVDVAGSGPGRLQNQTGVLQSTLRWFRPNVTTTAIGNLHLNEVNPLKCIIDNTDFGLAANPDASGNNVGPYDPLPNGSAASTGTWNAPLESEEALFPYLVSIRHNVNTGNAPGFQARNPNPRWPAHIWAASTSSAAGVSQDPRQAVIPGNLNTFTWTFTPKLSTLIAGNYVVSNDLTPKGYAMYVWIPAGLVSPGGVARPRQRYWAYQITYGIGQTYVDIVDTEASGAGWVRLGNGGHPTNQVFQYDGVNPLKITLYNTIVRNSTDQLTETVNGAFPDNRFAVFADAALFSAETDSYFATPTSAGFGSTDIRVVGARNERVIDPLTMPAVGDIRNKPLTVDKGVVTSYDYNTGNERWRYSPLEDGADTSSFDDTNVRFTFTGGFVQAFDNANARGGEYLKGAPVVISPTPPTDNVTVNPQTDLSDGSYQLQMYVGGDLGGVNYAKGAQYEIFEGGVSAGVFTLDMSGPAGYKTLGNRRYVHSAANPLRIVFYNSSTDATDAAKNIYVDQVRFVGSVGTSITSTPVHAHAFIRLAPGAAPVETNVVIVADERGRLHCLDATGNGDGTTTCYWTYPSSTTAANDPNLQPGQDTNDPNTAGNYQKFDGEADTLQATMPTDFDLSSAVVQRLQVTSPGPTLIDRDFLVIGSKNGRVYTIAMEGRGDFNAGTKTPGTTFRRWTFPETYPATVPQLSQLGSIASVTSGQVNVGGTPTDVVIIGTEQGRMYCLDAKGDFTYSNGNQLKTNIIWQYPPATSATLPAISGAPAIDIAGNRVFFGTHAEDGNPARFMALDAGTGTPLWATPNNSITDAVGTPPTQLDWFSGPCYVSAAQLNSVPSAAAPMPNTVFAMNENGNVYGINADTGAVIWRTNELLAGGPGSITYTEMTTYNNGGVPTLLPVVMVPTDSGRFAALFARLGEETRFGNRQAWGYEVDASIQATMVSSNKWLFGATTNGYLLAWSDLANAGSTIGTGSGPGNETATDNDPAYDSYRTCEVAFLSRAGFVALRQTLSGSITGTQAYANVIDTALAYAKPYGKLKAPFRSTHGAAFEWGETIYVIAYNFPFSTTDTGGNDIAPPVVEATVTTEGRSAHPIAAEARLFSDKTSADPDGGYAIFQIPLTAGGNTSHTPGPGSIKVQIRTSAVNSNNTQQSITLNPALTQLDYKVANPLGISVEQNFTTTGTSTEQLGYTVDPNREDALDNGSHNLLVTGVGNVFGELFGKSVGTTAHASSKKTNIYVFDRSLITLLRGEGRGLDLIKVDRKDLHWQGGSGVVAKPFSGAPGIGPFLGNYEDLPTNFPNNSLDYPDIAREQVKVRKDPNGNVENPVFSPVTLKGPVGPGGTFVDETNASTRTIVPTVFEFQVDVPKYQPVNLGLVSIPNQNNPGGGMWQAGYTGRFTVFVDSDQSGSFGGNSREAYRTFNLAAAVSPDERIVIGTPNVDLGSLSSGAGYDARLTYSNTFPYRTLSPTTFFNPDAPQYKNMFKPYTAYNDGNMNLWNVRLAKGTLDVTGGLYWPWEVLSAGNNEDIWLDAATDVHSNIDTRFAPILAGGVNYVFAQKPRVGDSSGRLITINPTSRLNPNILGAGTSLLPTNPNAPTVISVTPPLGMPIGRYSQLMRLVEDTHGTGPNSGANDESISIGYTGSGTVVNFESYSDPTFTLSFTVKETQLTGGQSTYVESGFNNGNVIDPTHPAQWNQIQPSGLRQTSGNLLVAFASNQPDFYPLVGNTNPANRNNRIYIGQVAGDQLGSADGRGQDSQIRDLNKFVPDDPANRRWVQALFTLPSIPDANIFQNNLTRGVASTTDIGGAITADVNYGNPVWSSNGDKDLAGVVQGRMYVAYTGTAKRQVNGGLVDDSRIIVSRINTSGPGGGTFVLDADPFALKGRPTMVQNGNDLTIFYPAFSNGVWSIYVTTFNEATGFSIPVMLTFGSGFESVTSPSVVQRTVQLNGVGSTEYDVTFTGRLRNSGISEVFMARIDPTFNYRTFGIKSTPTTSTGDLVENAVYDARFGAYRVRGAAWQGAFDVTSNGASILTTTPVLDRQTQLQTASTIYGGRVVVDPMLGTVKFTGTSLPKNLAIQVTYSPTFMRLSDTGVSSYNSPSTVFDTRLESSNTASNYAFWMTPTGNNEPANSINTFADRLVMTAVRGAVGGGQTSRPAMSTFRLGIRLGRSILVNPDGSLAEAVNVTNGNVGSYQIDPAAGRIYFTHLDEDRVLHIHLGGSPALGIPSVDIDRPVTFVGESAENFVTMENAMNESNLYMFLDPVGTNTNRRGMIWMLWSSMRNGAPSVFMQTIARKIIPILPPN